MRTNSKSPHFFLHFIWIYHFFCFFIYYADLLMLGKNGTDFARELYMKKSLKIVPKMLAD